MTDEIKPSVNLNYPTIISFYTDTWEYPKYAAELVASCDRLGLDHYVVELSDSGVWIENTRKKPRFILDTINKLQRPVVWMDADGSLYKLPTLFEGKIDADFGAVTNNWDRQRQWHVCTLFFNYTDLGISLLTKWADYMDDFDWSDELGLEVVLRKYKEELADLNVMVLPPTYTNYYQKLDQQPTEDTVMGHRFSVGKGKDDFQIALRARTTPHPQAGDYLKD